MACPSPLLGLPLLLSLLQLFWVPTGAGVPNPVISQIIGPGKQGHRNIILTCHANGIQDPRRYKWSTIKGSLPQYAVPSGAQLVLQPLGKPINNDFICQVSHGWKKAMAKRKVVFPGRRFSKTIQDEVDSDDSGFSSGQTEPDPESDPPYLIAIYVVVGLVVVVLVLLLCFWCYRKCC